MTESPTESLFPSALVRGREAADRARARLLAAGTRAVVVTPGTRFHDLPPDMLELRVPATAATRARVLLAGLGD